MQAFTPYLHAKAWPLRYLPADLNADIHVLVWLEFSKWNIFGQALPELTADRNNSEESWFSSKESCCSKNENQQLNGKLKTSFQDQAAALIFSRPSS